MTERQWQEEAEAAAAGTAPRCGERRTYGGREHECSRPPHGRPYHYFVAIPQGATS